jgi:hypothetical protein
MRRRITRALLAIAEAAIIVIAPCLAGVSQAGAAAVGQTITLAPSATQIGTAPCSAAAGFADSPAPVTFGGGGCAGYVGSGRDFRYAQAVITVPQATVVPVTDPTTAGAAPALYVGLTSGDVMAAAGLMTCRDFLAEFAGSSSCGPVILADDGVSDFWLAVGWVATNGASTTAVAVPLTDVAPGDGVRFQVYYPGTGAVHFTITTTSAGTPVPHSFQLPPAGTVSGPFDHAVALVDYSASDLGGSPARPGLDPSPAAGAADLRITQFRAGGWTTTDGARGTFRGPWTLNAATLTSGGFLPPAGAVHVEPAYLWNDGLGTGAGDAFGVWWRH